MASDNNKTTDLSDPDSLLFASTPSKKKEKKLLGNSKKNLFVRNLPTTATNDTLENLFSDIGPIKRCFVVTDTENHEICAGYGFVHFAMEDDAQNALKKLQGHNISGKKIIIEQAIPRETRSYIPKSQRVDDEDEDDQDEDMAPIEATPRKKQRNQLKM